MAHFDCQCSKENNYKGTLSQILSDPLSTVPLLHIRNTNVTINVNLSHCGKLKLALDFTELLAQRSASNIDFVLKVSPLDLILIFDRKFLKLWRRWLCWQNSLPDKNYKIYVCIIIASEDI